VTLKIDFFREINLSLFVLLQTIQRSFETFFNESLRSRKIWIAVISNWTLRIDCNANINKRKMDIQTLMNNIFYNHAKMMISAWIECKKRMRGGVNTYFTFHYLFFLPKCYLFMFWSLFFCFWLTFWFLFSIKRKKIFNLIWFKEWISSSKISRNVDRIYFIC